MSVLFPFIAARTTYARPIGPAATGLEFERRVAASIRDISNGMTLVGEVRFFPLGKSQTGFLMCDGTEVNITDFPELFRYLAHTMGAASTGKFKLPNYFGALTTPPTAPTQTLSDSGTVKSSDDAITTPTGDGVTGGTQGGNTHTFARPRSVRPA